MFSDCLLLNIVTSFLLGRSGASGNRVTEPPCDHLWGLYVPPTFQYLKIWGTSSSFAITILVSPPRRGFAHIPSLFFVSLSEQELSMVDILAAVLGFDVFYVNDFQVSKTDGSHRY